MLRFYVSALILPLSIGFGFSTHLVSPFLNLIFVPLFFLVIAPLSLVSILIPSLESSAAHLIKLFHSGIHQIAQFLSATDPLLFLHPYVGLLLFIAMLLIFFKNGLSLKTRVFLVGSVFICAFVVGKMHSNTADGVSIRVLDVAQGDALLLDMQGKRVVIDGGGNAGGSRQLKSALF